MIKSTPSKAAIKQFLFKKWIPVPPIFTFINSIPITLKNLRHQIQILAKEIRWRVKPKISIQKLKLLWDDQLRYLFVRDGRDI